MTAAKKSRQRQSKKAPPPPSLLTRYRGLLLGLAALAGVLAIIFILFRSTTAVAYTCDSLLTPPPIQTSAPVEVGFVTSYLGNTHVPVGSTIAFGFCPPTSGNHYNSPPRGPIPPAIYGPATIQPPGGWVHNLEHGYVVLLYRCPTGVTGQGDCPTPDEMNTMSQWFNDLPSDPICRARKAVVVRFDSMTTRFAVAAWNRALMLDAFNDAGLAQAGSFAKQWTNTTAPEPGNC